MIDHQFTAEYLNPELWNHLNEVLAPVYACNGRTLHIYQNEHHRIAAASTGEVCSHKEEKADCEYDRVIRYSKEGVIRFYRQVEKMEFLSKSIDEYQFQINQELNKTEGIDMMGEESRSSLFLLLQNALPKGNFACLLWITDEVGQPFFNCILNIREDKIVLVSTSDRYEPEPVTFEECVQKVAREFPGQIVSGRYTYMEWCKYVAEKIVSSMHL